MQKTSPVRSGARARRLVLQTLTYIAAYGVTLFYIIPMLLVLLTSLKSEVEAKDFGFTLPEVWRFDNYATVLSEPGIGRSFLNGVIVTTGVTVVTIVICALAAFVIARRSTRVSRGVYSYLLAGMIAPFAFLPAIKLLQMLGLYGSFAGLILVDVAIQAPFITLILVGFIKQIPRELDEAAILDGCGRFTLFFRVIFPLLKPITFTAMVLLVTFAWNEFQNVLFLMPDSNTWTMPMSVFNYQGLHTYNYALVCANLVITILPVLAVYLFAQKYIMAGMLTGSVKG